MIIKLLINSLALGRAFIRKKELVIFTMESSYVPIIMNIMKPELKQKLLIRVSRM